ncbi:pilus protein PilZ [Novosphingobium barchaimii LL02]|uniref:Pilus protein PilZ n=1 Tax=Novosphingobium barchaimii LL02 TaxID=1114963 RepID=A0A0J7XUY3_9SPHN|nr:PilZ domain-containing protein [Novosphingobium barchaimii]KMS55432.1 pilus protein PilZ [Novosphingobium barchaimii LL02]
MNFPGSLSTRSAASSADQRATPRFALLLRAAKLVSPGGEYLCIVRDVSATGVKLRLFHSLAGVEQLALESVTGERTGVNLVWEHGGEAGFRFVQPIDVERFIAEAGPYPKRPIRICVDHPARITVTGSVTGARLLDLSRQGARIETDQRLAIGQQLRIDAAEMPQFEATVCWRREPAYGLVFRQLMSLEELAQRTFRMQALRGIPSR